MNIPLQAGSVILDCILSLDTGFTVDNSTLHVPFYDLSSLFHYRLRLQKSLYFLANERISIVHIPLLAK